MATASHDLKDVGAAVNPSLDSAMSKIVNPEIIDLGLLTDLRVCVLEMSRKHLPVLGKDEVVFQTPG